ncbi:hypothetical protein ABZ619_26220 [Streptomyces sp. NPDC007851]|uniref:hypothetical protein n=1 Tax=Streptomyces sp. NPDC007851 TaxID=3155008 RepID=UPI0033CE6099
MSDGAFVIDESARRADTDVWFALPPGFVPLPLEELTAADDPARTAGRLSGLGPVLRLARLFLEAGAVRCCLGLHTDDEADGGPLLSLFTLAWRAAGWAPRSVLAARAASGPAAAEHLETLELPCGPAALVQTRLEVPSELGLHAPGGLLQITAHVPCPDGRRIAILSLATTAAERARPYRDLLRDVARTVSFEDPLPAVSDDVPDKD